jgi:DNA-binding transcriptional LysR family regulator
VRISCPVALLNSGVAAVISQYLVDNPQVQVLLDATNRQVEVVDEGPDVAIRVRPPPLENTDLTVRHLGLSAPILVASPELVARLPAPASIDALKEWPILSMASDNEKFASNLIDESGQVTSWTHQPRFATNDLASLRIAAIRGVGVARLPRELVAAALRPADCCICCPIPLRRHGS